MINLTSSGGTITFAFDNNSGYLQNGTIEVPVNSLSLIVDGSDMVTFKKANSNDVFVSALASDFGMSKAQLISFYKNNMVDSFINADEAQSMIDESISGKADYSAATVNISEDVTTTGRSRYEQFNIDYSNNVYYISASFDEGIEAYSIGLKDSPSGNTIWVEQSTSAGETDSYIFTKNSSSFVLTTKGSYKITSVTLLPESDYVSYAYIASNNVEKAVSTVITDEIEPALSAKADTSAVTQSINEAVSGKASQSDLETVSGQVATKQDILSAGTGIDITNNVISATGGGGGEGTVSGYTYRNENFKYEYADEFTGPVYIKYDGYSGDSENRWAGRITIANSEWSSTSSDITLVLEDGVIIDVAYYGLHLNVSVENGIAAVTPDSGYYILSYAPMNNFVGYVEKVYSSGNTSDVIENTVYDMLDNLSDGINAVDIKQAYFGLTKGNLQLTLEKGSAPFGASVTLGSPTINTEGGKLNTQFATPEESQKTLNTGQWSMCDVGGNNYDSSYDDMTITFNSGYTGGSISELMYARFINSGGSGTNEYAIIYNVTANTISYDASLSNYCTITDTVSTDYKIKITPNTGYRIRSFTNKNCSIAGVDAADKSDYAIVLITTTSYIQDGQAVIDDIYSKLAALEARLNNS